MTPFLGTRSGAGGRELRLGVGWTLGEALRSGVEASRSGSASVPADHGMRLMAVESGRSVLRAANPGFPDIAVIRAVVVFVVQAV